MQPLTLGGTCGGANTRRLIERRNQKRRVIRDESDQPVPSFRQEDASLLPMCDDDQEMESAQLLCTNEDILEGVGSQVGHQTGGKDNEQGPTEEGLCDGLPQREIFLATAWNGKLVRDDTERGTEGAEREEDEVETDEELSEGTRGKARGEKEGTEMGEEMETRTENRKGDRDQTLEENGREKSEDAQEGGKDTNKRSSSASAMPSAPLVNQTLVQEQQGEVQSKECLPKEPKGDRTSAAYQQNDMDNGKAGASLSGAGQDHVHSSAGGGQAEVAIPTPVLLVPPTTQVPSTRDHSFESHSASLGSCAYCCVQWLPWACIIGL